MCGARRVVRLSAAWDSWHIGPTRVRALPSLPPASTSLFLSFFRFSARISCAHESVYAGSHLKSMNIERARTLGSRVRPCGWLIRSYFASYARRNGKKKKLHRPFYFRPCSEIEPFDFDVESYRAIKFIEVCRLIYIRTRSYA